MKEDEFDLLMKKILKENEDFIEQNNKEQRKMIGIAVIGLIVLFAYIYFVSF